MEQIKSLLAKSNLATEEQNELLAILKLLPTAEINELFNFLNIHPEWIDKLYHNYKQKKAAATTKDYSKWQEIFDEEKKELEKL